MREVMTIYPIGEFYETFDFSTLPYSIAPDLTIEDVSSWVWAKLFIDGPKFPYIPRKKTSVSFRLFDSR
jgi:hypothetical protein